MSAFETTSEHGPTKKRKRSPVKIALVLVASGIFVTFAIRFYFQVEDASRRIKSDSFLTQIGGGIHRYDSDNGRLPPQAICDKDGKKLLSWRVAILPYIEQDVLHARFKLDEPWDSPHNVALIPEMPYIYATQKDDRKKGLSSFKVFAGKNTPFEMETSSEGLRSKWSIESLSKSPRGLSNIILCIEAGDPVIWTKPEDWDYDPEQPLPDMKPIFPGYFTAALGDGRTTSIRKGFKESTMRASIDPNSTSKELLDE